jgi:hypothetical protein
MQRIKVREAVHPPPGSQLVDLIVSGDSSKKRAAGIFPS